MGRPTNAQAREEAGRGPAAPAAAAGERTVTELVILLQEGEDDGVATTAALLDELWSAQYLAPGALCAFAGDAVSLPGRPLVTPAATHALALRFGAPAAAQHFVDHPAFSAPASTAIASGLLARPPTILAFETRAPDDLEPLFRRGPEWEAGLDLCLVFAPAPSQPAPGAGDPVCSPDAFVSDLAALAESSLAGALQACPGRLVSPPTTFPGGATHALVARFELASQAAAFLALPPLVAAAGGVEAAAAAGSPLLLVAVEAWSIAPAAAGNQQAPPVGAPR
jgi:hypothetical protein